jgi:hypothetical protein
MTAKQKSQWDDPAPYDGPIERLDGRRPYNRYLWPMEGDSWWVRESEHLVVQRMAWPNHIAIVALADGQYSTDGSVHAIEENRDCYGGPCIYPTRQAAIRKGVAKFIRHCRHARYWPTNRITHEQCQLAVNWALAIVARPPITMPTPKPQPRKTGLPLFDIEVANA